MWLLVWKIDVVESFDADKLFIDVFAAQPGEKVLVMRDRPHGQWTDSETWAGRREIAVEWHAAFQRLGTKVAFGVHPRLEECRGPGRCRLARNQRTCLGAPEKKIVGYCAERAGFGRFSLLLIGDTSGRLGGSSE